MNNVLLGRLHSDIADPTIPGSGSQPDTFIPQSLSDCKAKKRRKIAIVGFATSFKKAPFNDPSWEIWGLNELYLLIPRYDRWFEIHSREACGGSERNSEHIKWLQEAKCPVYMWGHDESIPNSVKFPIEDCLRKFPRYFTNSISYMIALAIMEAEAEGNIDTIGLWGCDMAMDEEYSKQRPSVEYFLGYAMGRGINVYVHEGSDMLKAPYLYGYETENPILTKMAERSEELGSRRYQLEQLSFNVQVQRAHALGQIAQLEGWSARVTDEELKKNMLASRDVLAAQIPQMDKQAQDAQFGMAKIDGVIEQINYERVKWFQRNDPPDKPTT